jgi:uncharacterized phage infection (PIP) family protein YhgE
MNYSQRFGIILMMIIGVILVWYTFYYSPRRLVLLDAQMYSEELQQQLSLLSGLTGTVEDFETQVNTLKSGFDQAILGIRNKQDFNTGIQEISNQARRYNVSINIINPSLENLSKTNGELEKKWLGFELQTHKITLQLTGKFLDIGRFMESVDRLNTPFHIESVQIVSDPAVYPELNAFISLLGYSLVRS